MEGLTISPALILVVVLIFYLITSIQILAEYERGVIFRLGKLLPQPKGPGVVFVFRPIDRIVRISLRTVVLDVPPQDIITRDNVSVKVNAVVYFRVSIRAARWSRSRTTCTPRRSWRRRRCAACSGRRSSTTCSRARAAEPAAAADPRQADRAVGHQGVGGRSQARRPAAGHAARDGEAGRGRAREAREDHPRRGRADRLGEAVAGGGVLDREPAAMTLRYLQTLPRSPPSRTRRSSSRCRWNCCACFARGHDERLTRRISRS